MYFPLHWLESYTPLSKTLLLSQKKYSDLAHHYSIHTAEIDGIEKSFRDDHVVIAKVLGVRKHENSDRLNIVQVDAGEHGQRQIVCGAPNAPSTRYAALALPGAVLGPDFVIQKSHIRGEVSEGMLCGSDEIGLIKDRSTGIIQLEDFGLGEDILQEQIGKPFFDLMTTLLPQSRFPINLPMEEVVFEVDNKFITNRPDLFGIYGHAREMSALFGLPFTQATTQPQTIHTAEHLIDESVIDHVSSYSLTHFNLGKPNNDTPDVIRILLSRLGEKSHTIAADASVLVMYEFGLPVHAYDADKISGDIRVRYAKEGEKMTAIGGKELTLSSHDIVISDSIGVIALAGVIGGERTAVDSTTKRVLLESACFDATSVRLTSARVTLRTAASMRYEKSQNPAMYLTAIERFSDYMFEYLGARAGESLAYYEAPTDKIITLHLSTLSDRAGIEISREQSIEILTTLGFGVEGDSIKLSVTIPAHRKQKDVTIEMDLIEEIIRIYGYENIPSLPFVRDSRLIPSNPIIETIKSLRRAGVGVGMHEVYNYSFSNLDQNTLFGVTDHERSIALLNPNTSHQTHMRRAMAPLMIETLKDNEKKADTMKLFEIGRIHYKNTDGEFVDEQKALFAWYGYNHDEIMRDIEELQSLIMPGVSRSLSSETRIAPGYHPKRYAEIISHEKTIAHLGYIHPSILEHYGLAKSCFLMEIDLTHVLTYHSQDWGYSPLSRFQTTTRELNFLTPIQYPFAELATLITQAHPLIQSVTHRENYFDAQRFGSDQRSQIIRYCITPQDESSNEELLTHIQEAVISHVESHSPARLRRD